MTKPYRLRDELKNVINQESLTSGELQSLMDLEQNNRFNRPRPAPKKLLFVAAAMIIFVTAAFWPFRWPLPTEPSLMVVRIVEEVTTNHTRIKPLDVHSDSFDAIRQSLVLLDFSPLESTRLRHSNLRLVGGRYCTLQGVIATQLVFVDEKGNRITVYQAAYDTDRFGLLPDSSNNESPLVLQQQGLDIEIWHESGVLIAVARSHG